MGIQLVYHMLVASRSSDDSVDVPLLGDGLAYYGASDLEAPSPLEVRFGVSGMTCASCVKTVETAVGRVPSVVDVAVNLLAGEAAVTLSSQSADPMDVVDAIERLGYEAVLKGLPSQVGSTTLLVEGMTCSSCVSSVETALMGESPSHYSHNTCPVWRWVEVLCRRVPRAPQQVCQHGCPRGHGDVVRVLLLSFRGHRVVGCRDQARRAVLRDSRSPHHVYYRWQVPRNEGQGTDVAGNRVASLSSTSVRDSHHS